MAPLGRTATLIVAFLAIDLGGRSRTSASA